MINIASHYGITSKYRKICQDHVLTEFHVYDEYHKVKLNHVKFPVVIGRHKPGS